MSTAVVNKQIAQASPRLQARTPGAFYVINITSLLAFSGSGGTRWSVVYELVATAAYVAVTILFYRLFKPVNRTLSLIAAAFSLLGCVPGVLSPFHVNPYPINSLVFFGFYCVLIGYLILKSGFLPKVLGFLMLLAGAGWLTFISPALAKFLSPSNYDPGGIGEISLCLWLLVMAVREDGWKDGAAAAAAH